MAAPQNDELSGKIYDTGLVRKLWPFMRPYKKALLASVALVPLLNGFQLLQPWLVKRAIDQHIEPGVSEGLWLIGLVFFIALVMEFVTTYGQIYLLNYTGQGVVRDLRKKLFEHVLNRSSRFFDRTPVGRLLTRLTNDLEGVSEMFASGIVSLVADLVKLVAIAGILFWMNWRLALATLAVAPPLFFLVEKIRDKLRTSFREVRTRIARLNAYLGEALSGMDLVQAFSQERRIGKEFSALGKDYRDSTYRAVKYDAILYAVVEFFGSLAIAVILWYGGIRIVGGGLTFGELVAFISYIQMFFNPIRDLSAKYATMQSGMASLERVFDVLEQGEAIPDCPPGQAAENLRSAESGTAGRGAYIEYKDVCFSYDSPATDDPEWAVQSLSFKAAPGERIALVGATGSGKSTTIKLLSRFYDPQRGSILFDGVDVRNIPLAELRRRIGVVSQDVFLFSGTILENIRLFDTTISKERVENACRAVGLWKMLERQGRCLDEPVLERGRNLSQGQRQLVSFARVLAFDPDVLVLDEATSSVDQETEHILQEAVDRVMEGRTSLIVAHRLATIRHSNRILVMHHGKLRETGTHDELVKQGGLYEKLNRLQTT